MQDIAPNPIAAIATAESAALAVNALGLDLHRQMPGEGNLCLSPYSIQSVLTMAYMGASGGTQEEMSRVLQLPADKQELGESFAALNQTLDEAQKESAHIVAETKSSGGPVEPLTLLVAHQLFGEECYDFRPHFLAAIKHHFGTPLQPMAFRKDPAGAAREINHWVSQQTLDRIHDLIPPRVLTDRTRLVLANALYFKAAWADAFATHAIWPEPFHANGSAEAVEVPMMHTTKLLRCFNGPGFQAVMIPYVGGRLHFLLIVPESVNGLPQVESSLTPEMLLACARAASLEVSLHLPKFKLSSFRIELSDALQKLGMTTAFNIPSGSADFDAMAPKLPQDYLCISKVMHKTFFELDERGAKAAAATAVEISGVLSAGKGPKPITLKADRPFLFAIQHAESGACLFLGRVSDPR